MKKYNPRKIEKEVQKKWEENKAYFHRDQKDKPKYYVLDMFPYPSGDGLHMGHTESYTASDIIYRYKRLRGFDVLHPQGFDSFGLPAENYAVKTGIHPKETTKKNTENYIRQMKMLGLGHDLDHLIYTSDSSYYKWTQWLFGKFFENGLVERKTDKINWCPSCNTGIANEQVENGKCERCKTEIEQKEVPGWFFKITDFAEDLINDLDKVDWPEATKKNQINWIGKSEGAKISFRIKKSSQTDADLTQTNTEERETLNDEISVFTTRPDTLFGATYLVLAPEHPLIEKLKLEIKNWSEVKKYIERAKNKTEMERLESKEKTGVKLEGLVAINPAIAKMLSQSQTDAEQIQKDVKKNILRGSALSPRESAVSSEAEIPIFVADYVLGGYGTGAIMAVPAHDERDFEFAKKYDLPIRYVTKYRIKYVVDSKFKIDAQEKINNFFDWVLKHTHPNKTKIISRTSTVLEFESHDYFGYKKNLSAKRIINFHSISKNVLINSGQFDGMNSEEAKKAITEFVGGEMTTNYRLRDWSISRQRYWGCPIPIVYSPEGEAKFVGEENLPWLLPEDVDFKPTGTAPLAKSKELKERTEKIFGKGWTPEVDTMDTFVDSSWYFLRYPDPENEKEFCSPEKLKRWLPVDLYIGGAEHTYMHLLYARFFVKAMYKMGLVSFNEPFLKLRHQGMVLDKNGMKMSKSKGNVVNPDDMVKQFGADATRMYMMFAGPLEEDVMWKEEGVKGVYNFLQKVWKIFQEKNLIDCREGKSFEIDKKLPFILHKTIKGVTEDIEELKFNTAISKLMIFINTASRIVSQPQTDVEQTQKDAERIQSGVGKNILRGSASSPRSSATLLKVMENFLILLSPFAPHLSQYLWEQLGKKDFILDQKWPQYDSKFIQEETTELVIQVNGKVRDKIKVPADISEKEAKEKALASEKIKKYTEGKEIKKTIFVPGRLINLVV